MKFILASSADLCQPDLIKIRLGPLRAIRLLSKIQEDACFVAFKETLLPYKVIEEWFWFSIHIKVVNKALAFS